MGLLRRRARTASSRNRPSRLPCRPASLLTARPAARNLHLDRQQKTKTEGVVPLCRSSEELSRQLLVDADESEGVLIQ